MNAHQKAVRIMRQTACAVVLATWGMMTSTADAAEIYFNDFDSVNFTNSTSTFTLDTVDSELDYVDPIGGGAFTSTASESISGVNGLDFTVSTRFTVNSLVDGGLTALTIGFGAFGSSGNFSTGYYLADWAIAGGGSGAGVLRILNIGATTGFSAVNSNIGEGTAGDYEMRLSGTFTGASLNMSLVVLDSVGNPIGAAATATHTAPFTGPFFGLRNRASSASHAIDASYDNFSVEVVPEPASMVLFALGVLGFVAANRGGRGRAS